MFCVKVRTRFTSPYTPAPPAHNDPVLNGWVKGVVNSFALGTAAHSTAVPARALLKAKLAAGGNHLHPKCPLFGFLKKTDHENNNRKLSCAARSTPTCCLRPLFSRVIRLMQVLLVNTGP